MWGQGLSISVRDQSDEGQDVQAVVQAFLDDPGNRITFSGSQAREEMEQSLYTDGEAFCALFTSPMTGRVKARWLLPDEIVDILTDPEDSVSHWYYKREYTERSVVDGRTVWRYRVAYYPALGYEPQGADRQRFIDGAPVYWDTPVRMVAVNRPTSAGLGATRGVPDSFAAIAWARSYKEFLEQWAVLMKALARYAWRTKTRGDKAKAVAAKVSAAPAADARGGNPTGAGATVVTDPNTTLEAIPKTGATIDADSGRPLAAMTATALEVPVTMLLGDPGVTGARAVADTLDQPMDLAMKLRRELWTAFIRDVLDHVIDWAVRAPKGPLTGRVMRDGERVLVELPDNDDRTLDIAWPDFDSTPVGELVKAIVEADSARKLPPLAIARLLAEALGIRDIDELLDQITDGDGNFIDPDATAGQAAIDAFRQGRDPAGVLDDEDELADDEA